jgi:hypothetical protein
MNESTPRQQSSEISFEQMKAQLLASAGNMGDKSSVIPNCLRGLPMQSKPLILRYLREDAEQALKEAEGK